MKTPRHDALLELLYGELDEDRARALRAAIAKDPELGEEWRQLQATTRALGPPTQVDAPPHLAHRIQSAATQSLRERRSAEAGATSPISGDERSSRTGRWRLLAPAMVTLAALTALFLLLRPDVDPAGPFVEEHTIAHARVEQPPPATGPPSTQVREEAPTARTQTPEEAIALSPAGQPASSREPDAAALALQGDAMDAEADDARDARLAEAVGSQRSAARAPDDAPPIPPSRRADEGIRSADERMARAERSPTRAEAHADEDIIARADPSPRARPSAEAIGAQGAAAPRSGAAAPAPSAMPRSESSSRERQAARTRPSRPAPSEADALIRMDEEAAPRSARPLDAEFGAAPPGASAPSADLAPSSAEMPPPAASAPLAVQEESSAERTERVGTPPSARELRARAEAHPPGSDERLDLLLQAAGVYATSGQSRRARTLYQQVVAEAPESAQADEARRRLAER